MYCLSPTGVCSFFARLCRGGTGFSGTPHAGGAFTFLSDQKSKQRSRRKCDSPFPTPVGTENRTFPGRQSLPVLRYQCKKPGVFLNLRLFRTGTGGNQPQLRLHVGPGAAKRHKKSMVSFDGLTKTPVKSWVEPPADLGLPTSRRRAGRRLECGNPPKRGKACPTSIELYAPSS